MRAFPGSLLRTQRPQLLPQLALFPCQPLGRFHHDVLQEDAVLAAAHRLLAGAVAGSAGASLRACLSPGPAALAALHLAAETHQYAGRCSDTLLRA